MKKILLSVLLVGSSVLVGMDQPQSWEEWFGRKEKVDKEIPEQFKQIAEEKSKLVTELSLKRWEEFLMENTGLVEYSNFTCDSMKEDPKLFLKLIYYWRYTSDNFWLVEELELLKDVYNKDLLEKVQKYDFDGYSALGMAVIAKELSREKKKKLVDKLLNLGFTPTQKDKQLADFEQWESI